ncbi:F-box protein At2g32560-like isoform X2 [Durio zibethinus]|uniref:F-box protein At2g32560-like isoform X2 n=1 Tax=Durio zibethinus TaxID=66656 RepID=A0A6P6ASP4_DURZI|nr:F-box protein At2g32560-like isoform X2 [Durio zibethinus]
MLLFLISCFSFILLSKSLSLKNHLRMKSEWRLLSPWFWEGFSGFVVSWFHKGRLGISFHQLPTILSLKKKKKMGLGSNVHNAQEDKMALLDLPELALECILERLSPAGLCSMAGVCSSFRETCISDHLWEKHMKQKWGKVIGDAAYSDWQWHIASRKRPHLLGPSQQKRFLGSLTNIWPFSWFRPNFESRSSLHKKSDLPVDSIMSWYLSLETGKIWFPAQVYNRENGHAGFMLSCYDAKLIYDSQTDTFQARYSPHGRRTTEENISWDRLRIPPVDTPSHDLHISECLLDLKPGDHIEIQWRRNKEFPCGWWYGVVGHLESCDESKNHCCCQYADTVMLEFKQYPASSRWRKTMINRNDHREVGNEADGFYGGIRKLYKEEEISMWKRLWPNQVLE